MKLILATILLFFHFTSAKREFKIDYENDQFLMDGLPFRYVSGSLHYFRVPSIYWRDRLRKLRSAGLNAVSTYIEWRSHEMIPGKYDFTNDLDIIKFIKIAQEEGLYVILRPGPYICAEREMGGLPYWLLRKDPKIQLRSSDITYMNYATRWLKVIMSKITPLLYGNGGPIIMVQVENEYGSYIACDYLYLYTLKLLMESFVKNNAVLYTTDGNSAGYLKCGKIKGVYATVDFGVSENVNTSFNAMRIFEPQGPLINSEFYTGWLDHWEDEHATVPKNKVADKLDEILSYNASVNFYMFFGGTNFGFTAGANLGGAVIYSPQLTSYDYDAPLNEAGDPTSKYYTLRDVISKYMPLPPGPAPIPKMQMDYGAIKVKFVSSLFEIISKKQSSDIIKARYPLTFEELDQWSGFVLYETRIVKCYPDPVILSTKNIHDRAQVFVNKVYSGTLSRMHSITSLPILVVPGDNLSLLLENQGRVNYGSGNNDFKGFLENITLNQDILEYWTMYKLPFDNYGEELKIIDNIIGTISNETSTIRENQQQKPYIFYGDFVLSTNFTDYPPPDTYLDLSGWFKGIVFINGFNLGRYWSVAGPQQTLYLPGSLLKLAPEKNRLIIFELERNSCTSSCSIFTRDTPVLDTKGCSVQNN